MAITPIYPPVPNIPISNTGNLYVSNLQLSWLSNTTLSISAGQTRDSKNITDLYLNSPVIINGNVSGVNGVDVGVIQSNTQYAVYLIGSSRSSFTLPSQIGGGPLNLQTTPNPYPIGGLLSLASNAVPYLPFGYDSYRRIGWVNTTSTNQFLLFVQYGTNQTRSYYFQVGQTVFDETAGTPTNVPLNLSLSNAPVVPPIATIVSMAILYASVGAQNKVNFWPFGFSSNNIIYGVGAVTTSYINLNLPSGLNGIVPTIVVQTGVGDTLNLSVVGFIDYL